MHPLTGGKKEPAQLARSKKAAAGAVEQQELDALLTVDLLLLVAEATAGADRLGRGPAGRGPPSPAAASASTSDTPPRRDAGGSPCAATSSTGASSNSCSTSVSASSYVDVLRPLQVIA
jgi:hypothetical protein